MMSRQLAFLESAEARKFSMKDVPDVTVNLGSTSLLSRHTND